MVQKAMCLRRRFSREVSSSDAILDPDIFPQFWPCMAPRMSDSPQILALSDATFPTFLSPFWSYCTKTCRVFTGGSLYVFPLFWSYYPKTKSLGYSQAFRRQMQNFPFHIFDLHCTSYCWVFTGFSSSNATLPTWA